MNDGRWGASLEVNPAPTRAGPAFRSDRQGRRPVPLLLYDLWNDPMCLHSLHEERPDLVEHYTAFLEAQWEAHQLLAQQFTPGDESPLTPELWSLTPAPPAPVTRMSIVLPQTQSPPAPR